MAEVTFSSLAAELRAQRVLLTALIAAHPDSKTLRRHFAFLMSREIEKLRDDPEAYSILRMYEEAVLAALGGAPPGAD